MRANIMHPLLSSGRLLAERGVVAEGALAGAYAASAVALGFLVADVAQGAPLATPALLGRTAASLLGVAATPAIAVAAYTALHYAAFALLGVVAAAVVRVARRDASVLAGALLVFAVVEVAFAGLVAALHVSTATGAEAWVELVGGNVVGWFVLAGVLWRWQAVAPRAARSAGRGRARHWGVGGAVTEG